MTTPDPRRTAAIDRARNELGLFVVELRTYATAPPEAVRAALDELTGPADRVTLGQLAVLADQCGMRLRLEAVPG